MKHYYVYLRNGDVIEEIAASKNHAIDVICEERGLDRGDIKSVRRVGTPDPEATCDVAA